MFDASIRVAYRVAHRLLRAYWYVRRPTTSGALAAVWHDGRVLLVKNSYRKQYTLPGGYVRPREDPRDAAARELFEETRVRLEGATFTHAYHGAHPFENRDDTLDIYEATLDTEPMTEVDQREVVWAGFKTPDEVRALDLVPHLREYLEGK